MSHVRHSTEWLTVPGESNRLCIRPLSGAELREARKREQAHSEKSLGTLVSILNNVKPEILASLDTVEREPPDPANPELYDQTFVINTCVIDWDYADDNGAVIPCVNPADGLDDATFTWAIEQILKRSVRSRPEAIRSDGPS